MVDVEHFDNASYLSAELVEILARYPVKYVLLPDDHALSCQLRHAPELLTSRFVDGRYRLYEVSGRLKVNPVTKGNSLLVNEAWQEAEATFREVLASQPNQTDQTLALIGLANSLRSSQVLIG